MIFYTAVHADGSTEWVTSQAAARDINRDFDQVDVPTTAKPDLLVFLNQIQARLNAAEAANRERDHENAAPLVADPMPAPLAQPTAPPRGLRALTAEISIEEQIMAADGKDFGRIFQATLERLGELRTSGWNNLRTMISNHPHSRTSIERGLGYLILESTDDAVA